MTAQVIRHPETIGVLIDLLRVFPLIGWTGMVLLTLRVGWLHYAAWSREADESRRLMPYHVWMIAGSYLLFGASSIWQTVSRVGEGLTFYEPLNLGAAVLGLWALLTVMQVQARRVDRLDRPGPGEADEEPEPSTEEADDEG